MKSRDLLTNKRSAFPVFVSWRNQFKIYINSSHSFPLIIYSGPVLGFQDSPLQSSGLRPCLLLPTWWLCSLRALFTVSPLLPRPPTSSPTISRMKPWSGSLAFPQSPSSKFLMHVRSICVTQALDKLTGWCNLPPGTSMIAFLHLPQKSPSINGSTSVTLGNDLCREKWRPNKLPVISQNEAW